MVRPLLLPRFAISLLLVSLAAACARRAEDASPARHVVEVAGRQVRVESAGLRGRKPGQTVVVFESGAGTEIDHWGGVLPAVAAFAPVLAYERPGIGQSEWDGRPPTPEHSVAVLRSLLATLDVPPPYVLVGHSWGGILVRYFAGRHPDDVAGLVYIDPSDVEQGPDDHVRVLESIGAPPSALDALEMEVYEKTLARAPSGRRWRRSGPSSTATSRAGRSPRRRRSPPR